MATKAKGPNKSEFIRQLLRRDPETNLKAVNAAWKRAGHTGSISNPLFFQVKPRALSTTVKGSGTGTAASKVSQPKVTVGATKKRGPKKSAFIRDLLGRNPDANLKAVNEAWMRAGYKGGISSTSLYLIKSQVNGTSATGGARGPALGRATGQKPATKPTKMPQLAHQHVSERNVASGSKGGVLDDLESEIDGLIFKLMGVGGMSEVEEALRRARRLIVRHQG